MGGQIPLKNGAEFIYQTLADNLESGIRAGQYTPGERLPSLRRVRQRTGASMTTVCRAYEELERRGLVQVRERSGYFVNLAVTPPPPSTVTGPWHQGPRTVRVDQVAEEVVTALFDPQMVKLGASAPAPDLLPHKHLNRILRSRVGGDQELLLSYGPPSGCDELRREIGRRQLLEGWRDNHAEIVITAGCMEAVFLCLRAVARRGDAVLVESPTFHGFLQLFEDLGLLALEVPTCPQEGVDLDALERVLAVHKPQAALLSPNFQNPTGSVMPLENKRRLLSMLTGRGIPVIEDDIYGDLWLDEGRPVSLKSIDETGLVLYCNSFSKSIAPGLRVGWVQGGRFHDQVKRLKLNSSLVSPLVTQSIIAEYLKSGAYDRHLRSLRRALKTQRECLLQAVARYFPADVRMTRPAGGLVLWLDLGERVDGLDIYHRAALVKIAVLPGALCSTGDGFKSFIRLSFGNPWTPVVEHAVKILGGLAGES